MPRAYSPELRAGIGGLENPSTDLYAALTGMFDGGPVSSGATVNATTALRVTTLMACVRLIAETVGMLPLDTVRRTGNLVTTVNAPQEQVIWRKPNKDMTRQFFWETITGHLCLTGNAYIYKVFDKLGRLAEIWPLDPRTMTVQRIAGQKVYFQHGVALADGIICHIPAFSTDGFLGMNPIQSARETIGIALSAEEYAARFYAQGASVAGIISVKDALDDDVAARLGRRFQKLHSGSRNAHKVAVLDNGATWQTVGLAPADAQFLEIRKFTNQEIIKLYRVPPHLMGEVDRSTSWGSGIEQQGQAFVIFTIGPWLTRIEAAIGDQLIDGARREARFNVDALLRGTMKERYGVYTQMRNIGAYNNDEIREMEGDAPLPDGAGSDYRQPMNSSAGIGGGAAKADGSDKAARQPGSPNDNKAAD